MKYNHRCGADVAWDDFDRFVETITGRETLHDTVDITCQTITEEESMDQEPDNDENLSSEEETCFTREVIEETQETFYSRDSSKEEKTSSIPVKFSRYCFI